MIADYTKQKDRNKLYQEAIDKWGQRSQLEMAQEESTELALSIRKFIRNPSEERHLDMAGEIADVKIMIEQLEYMLKGLRTQVNIIKELKLIRLSKTLLK